MNLSSKQRAYLGSLASTMNPIFHIGKASLTPEIVEALDAALEKRELIKVGVLKNCLDDPKEIANAIAERTHSTVVKVIGKKMIFYRKPKKTLRSIFRNKQCRLVSWAGRLIRYTTDICIWRKRRSKSAAWMKCG